LGDRHGATRKLQMTAIITITIIIIIIIRGIKPATTENSLMGRLTEEGFLELSGGCRFKH
jgi:hypothetical protein